MGINDSGLVDELREQAIELRRDYDECYQDLTEETLRANRAEAEVDRLRASNLSLRRSNAGLASLVELHHV